MLIVVPLVLLKTNAFSESFSSIITKHVHIPWGWNYGDIFFAGQYKSSTQSCIFSVVWTTGTAYQTND